MRRLLCFCSALLVSFVLFRINPLEGAEQRTQHINLTDSFVVMAENISGIKLAVNDCRYMKSITTGGDDYAVCSFSPYGFAIFYLPTNTMIEACFSEGATFCVPFDCYEDLYYGGPFVYCSQIGSRFYEHFSNAFLTNEEIAFYSMRESKAIESLVSANKEKKEVDSTRTQITVAYDYFSDLDEYGINNNGTCTVLAAAVLMGYYDYAVNDQFVSSIFRDGDGTNDYFHQLLNSYVFGGSSQHAITINDASSGFNSYLSSRNLCTSFNYVCDSNSSVLTTIENRLISGKPVIASMFQSYGANLDHTCVVYGLSYPGVGYPLSLAMFTVNMCWHNHDYDSYQIVGSWFSCVGYIDYHSQHDNISYNSQSHSGTCTYCGKTFSGNHAFSYQQLNSTKHIKYCACSYSAIELHDFPLRAYRTCSKCGYRENINYLR